MLQKSEHKYGSQWATLKALLPYIWPPDRPDLRLRVAIALLLLVAAKGATVAVPFFYKAAVDALTTGADATAMLLVAGPLGLIVAYGLGRVMMVLFAQARDALFSKVVQHAVRAMAVKTFRHMHRLSLRFHLERKTGGLSRIIERGTRGIEVIVRYTMLNSAPTVLELALIGGVLFYHFSFWYLLVMLVTVAAYVSYTFVASEWRIGIRRVMNESDTDANTKAVDSLLNYETVKYFGNEGWEANRFDGSMQRYERAAVRSHMSLAVLNSGQTVFFTIGLTVCMLMAARDVAAGGLTIGDFVMVNALLIQLFIPLNFMGMVYREIKQGLVDIENMFDLLGKEPEIADVPGARPLAVRAGEIRFSNVDFFYDANRQILHRLSFTVPPGKTVAIVGPSGAGKSTISRILFRFYDVAGGQVLIDGQDIRMATQDSLRRAIGMVPQDTVLFNDTIAYNIRYGRPDASDKQVYEAARMAQIDEFIRTLPSGYDTEVGERGLKLSGGEKQRVAIARTILKGPPILMLDEATSALDSATEQEIQAALRRVSENRTTLVIAHRLSTIIDADEILVLKAGRIVERGRHAGLLERGGLYADMWNRQREAEEARARLAEAEIEGAASPVVAPVEPSPAE
jgi:ATP-binding cassette subfamily B protein